MKRNNDPWFKFHARDWLDGTRQLSLEQRAAYIDAIAMQMLYGTPLPDDYAWLGHQMHISPRKAKVLVDGLVAALKLKRTADGLTNERCEQELLARAHQSKVNTETAINRERKFRENAVKLPRKFREISSKLSPAGHENSKNVNTFNNSMENSCIENSTTRARLDTDTDIERRKTPPCPPQEGEGQRDGFSLLGEPSPKPKRERRPSADGDARVAIDLYNRAATINGWQRCEVVTETRLRRTAARLSEIGGLKRFEVALAVAPRDDFLMGRAPTRAGAKPFKLDLERLLSTQSGMGDVLAKLLDLAASNPEPTKPQWWQKPANVAQVSDDQWRAAISRYANGVWPVDKLSPPPGHPECKVPERLIDELGLKDAYDESGVKRGYAEIYKGEITHG